MAKLYIKKTIIDKKLDLNKNQEAVESSSSTTTTTKTESTRLEIKNFVNNVNKKKETIVKIGNQNKNSIVEIELLPFNNNSTQQPEQQQQRSINETNLLLYDNLRVSRESIKIKKKVYFENLIKLMRNNFAIIFLFLLCGLPVSTNKNLHFFQLLFNKQT
jgi:hypothetical protein